MGVLGKGRLWCVVELSDRYNGGTEDALELEKLCKARAGVIEANTKFGEGRLMQVRKEG